MFSRVSGGYPRRGLAARRLRRVTHHMNQLEQFAHDVRGFATEVRMLGYSSARNENPFIELAERMTRCADQAARAATLTPAAI